MVKVFTTNENGKIEFTKEELEALLNEVWNDGYRWVSPTITTPQVMPNYYSTITCDTEGR